MSTIVLRNTKGSELTYTELDNNLSNLNTDKVEKPADDTTTNASFYPLFITNSGNTSKISTTKLSFNPSTGTLNSVIFNATSDARLKDNIRALPYGLPEVLSLVGRMYEMKDSGKISIGLVAQEVQPIIPEVVNESAEGTLGINYPVLTAVLIEAIKTLSARLDNIESK